MCTYSPCILRAANSMLQYAKCLHAATHKKYDICTSDMHVIHVVNNVHVYTCSVNNVHVYTCYDVHVHVYIQKFPNFKKWY